MPQTPRHRMHPEEETLSLFLTGTLPGDTEAEVEQHLRKACMPCLLLARELALQLTDRSRRALTRGLFGASESSSELRRYGAWLDRKLLLIDLETALVPSLIAELMLRPAAARRELVRNSRRYQILSVAQALREESRREGFRDVARAVELAELGVEVADCLDPVFYGGPLVADERALCYAVLGNTYRITGDLFGAERQLRTALDLLDYGTCAPTEEAEVLSLLASLRTDQSRFEESIELLTVVAECYRSQGLPRLEGKALIKLAIATSRSGAPGDSVELLSRAVGLLDEDEDTELAFSARHNIAASLTDAGRFEEAREYLRSIGHLYERAPEQRSALVLKRWTEGLIGAGLGESTEAESVLQEVRATLLDQNRAIDHALATLDLATLYLSQGRTEEVKHLAEEMYPIFRSQDVHRQALAALALFKQSALSEAITIGFVRDVAKYLDRARNNPYLAFEPTQG